MAASLPAPRGKIDAWAFLTLRVDSAGFPQAR